MKVKLLRDAKIKHSAGEIVEVSPAEAHFLMSLNGAIPVCAEKQEEKKKTTAKKK